MKPQLAEDAILDLVQFPCLIQPKIDGVRALNLNGTLTGRSLDAHKGTGITEYFSKPEFLGLDGEMTLGDVPNSPDRLCSLTTGAMSRFKGVKEMPDVFWWCFDLLTQETLHLSYVNRYYIMKRIVDNLADPRVKIVPCSVCDNLADLKTAINDYAEQGYEGTIIRNPRAMYKEGRATKKNQELWRVKPWADAEILVTGITEGEENQNEAKTNTLGRTERSSAQSGMVPNGRVGSIQGKMLADFYDSVTGTLLFRKGLPITVSKGEMTHEESAKYFNNPDTIVGHIVKFKHMPFGVKDLPRFPTYISHRAKEDME